MYLGAVTAAAAIAGRAAIAAAAAVAARASIAARTASGLRLLRAVVLRADTEQVGDAVAKDALRAGRVVNLGEVLPEQRDEALRRLVLEAELLPERATL